AAVPPMEQNPAVSRKLQAIIGKCLEKDRRLRYQSASEIATDLRRLKRPEDTAWSGTRSRGGRSDWRGAVRRPATRTAVLAMAALLIGPASWWMWHKTHPGVAASAPAAGSEMASLAVLPLRNLSGDP